MKRQSALMSSLVAVKILPTCLFWALKHYEIVELVTLLTGNVILGN